MLFAHLINKAKTHSGNVILIAFPQQNGYANAPQCCFESVRTLPVLFSCSIYCVVKTVLITLAVFRLQEIIEAEILRFYWVSQLWASGKRFDLLTQTCTHARACTHTDAHTRARAHSHTYSHARTHTITHTRAHTPTRAHARTDTHTRIQTRARAHTRTQTHTHTHTHASTRKIKGDLRSEGARFDS